MSEPRRLSDGPARGVQAAALVIALRQGWTKAERGDLTEAVAMAEEIAAALQLRIPTDLRRFYGDEFEALGIGFLNPLPTVICSCGWTGNGMAEGKDHIVAAMRANESNAAASMTHEVRPTPDEERSNP